MIGWPGRSAEARAVDLRLGPSAPGLVVRLLAGVWAALAFVVAISGPGSRPGPVTFAVLVVLLIVLVVRPATGVAALVVLTVGLRVVAGDPPGWPATAALVLLVHLVLWTSAVAARTGVRTRVELAAVLGGWREAVAAQAGAQVAVVLVGLVGDGPRLGDPVRVGALVLAGVVLVAVLPRRARTDQEE
ncbi:hypothetical protein ACTHAM_001183 [Cellulomonas soli]|uniref:hypothetical protein n=1 Tax=Cellulomonas soli TaxID=931535 RepID=UPI003F83A2D9